MIENNIAFAEIPRGDHAKIDVIYKSGAKESADVRLNAPLSEVKLVRTR